MKKTLPPKSKNIKPKTTKRRGRPPKITRALVPLDTKKIRKEYLKIYKKEKKKLDKLEADLITFYECDEPEFQSFMATRFGAEKTRQRELSEQIRKAEERYEVLCAMANLKGLRVKKYCELLEEMVTPELDFWAVLDNAVNEFKEQQKERFARYEEEYEEDYDDDDDDDDDYDYFDDDDDIFDFDDFDDFDEFEEGYKRFQKSADDFFRSIFGDSFPGDERCSATDHKELKKLYRELCLRYHPDKTGTHNMQTKRLWISIQEAYHDKDLTRLRTIHAGIEISSGKTELAISDIQAIIAEIHCSIHSKRGEVREKKRTPFWRFSKWKPQKRQKTEKDIAETFQAELARLTVTLNMTEARLARLRKPEKPKRPPKAQYKAKPKSRKQAIWEEAAKNTPDLF